MKTFVMLFVFLFCSVVLAQVVESAPVEALQVQDEILVPPDWMQNTLITLKAMPIVGPYVAKALQYIGVIASITTALCAFLLAGLKALQTVLNLAQLTTFAGKIVEFQNSKVMYYLKMISLFNAQKPQAKKREDSGQSNG